MLALTKTSLFIPPNHSSEQELAPRSFLRNLITLFIRAVIHLRAAKAGLFCILAWGKRDGAKLANGVNFQLARRFGGAPEKKRPFERFTSGFDGPNKN